jgi:UDP-glucose/galactose:(glucosyl)LPS alpha-1,2-glucosyl/galactosyltransferase
MNILVTTDKNYLQHAYAMLVSLLENNPDNHINLYYIHYDIDDDSLIRFRDFFSKTNLSTVFIKVDAERLRGLWTDGYITPAAYLRISCADLLPRTVERILYLDPDIIIKKPLDELYGTDLGRYCIAAVDNPGLRTRRNAILNMPADSRYFNSGVLLINVERYRRERISERVLDFSRKMGAKLNFHDQDALNAILHDRWFCLHPKWNVHTEVIQMSLENSRLNTREIREAVSDPAIIHFTSIPKPWEYSCTSPFREEYWRYLEKTPYGGSKPASFSYPNMIRKYLSKIVFSKTLRRVRVFVPSGLKSTIKKHLMQKRNGAAKPVKTD